ncbi:helix-turn-helix domain-containing protein [Serratia marcescens]|uniref:XRE family transcriptional regulator n=1 Tax=Serratia marcescens TaxID=615 RepID=UPI001CBC4F66|nr:S24 family peptidase [Serratia marcescens]MDM3533610.1 helix-turn-helix domain-containing protein [Serratia marcescens]MDM3540257.1 helix-turn-helix domain-containing protein [Serratia marcescens]
MQELIVQSTSNIIEPMVQEEKERKEFSRRLARACDRAGMELHGRQVEIARALRLTPKAVSKWFNAEAIPRRGKMAELADYIGTSVMYLIGESDEDGVIEAPRKSSNLYRVDVLDIQASAGPGVVVSSEVSETVNHIVYDSQEALEVFGHRPPSSIKVITVTGDSMAGTIELGDYIFVDVSKDYFVNDGIYVFFYKGKLLVKRLQLTGDSLLVRSDNPKYSDWKITEENEQYLKIVGKVIYSHAIRRHG